MRVIDDEAGDGGSLDSWTLDICVNQANCNASDTPVLSGPTSACAGESVTFTVTGNLNDAADWEWYTGTCGGTSLGSGASITFNATNSTTIFVRGEGGCVVPSSCDFQSFPVTSVNSDVTVSSNGVTLSADQNGATYQWIDCSGSTPIVGETGQSFTATANGDYQVEVTRNSCTALSSCTNVGTVGVEENNYGVSIYPNPSSTGVYILDVSNSELTEYTKNSFFILSIVNFLLEWLFKCNSRVTRFL